MRLLDEIVKTKKHAPVKQAARELDMKEADITSALEQLIPAITGGIKKNLSQKDGLEKLLDALNRGQHDRYLESREGVKHRDMVTDGNGILAHVLGNKEVSRELAKRAAKKTGLDYQALKKLLPIVASMTMGALKKQTSQARNNVSTSRRSADALDPFLVILEADGADSLIDDLFGSRQRR